MSRRFGPAHLTPPLSDPGGRANIRRLGRSYLTTTPLLRSSGRHSPICPRTLRYSDRARRGRALSLAVSVASGPSPTTIVGPDRKAAVVRGFRGGAAFCRTSRSTPEVDAGQVFQLWPTDARRASGVCWSAGRRPRHLAVMQALSNLSRSTTVGASLPGRGLRSTFGPVGYPGELWLGVGGVVHVDRRWAISASNESSRPRCTPIR